MTPEQKIEAYLGWVDNYVSTEKFAADRGITADEAVVLIAEGRALHESSVVEDSTTHEFTIRISGCTREQAEQVLHERLGHDEDYGFPYTLKF